MFKMFSLSESLSSNWQKFPFLGTLSFLPPSLLVQMFPFVPLPSPPPAHHKPISLSLSLSLSHSLIYLALKFIYCCVNLLSFQCHRERARARQREMGRGRIEIKKIENSTNRQVTYSKRKMGIMKKAMELTVLCDAEVSAIMFSSSGKFADYCSPSTNTKRIMDRYQQATGIDLWSDQYEKMQNTLRNLEEINRNLRKEIRQRMGEDLDELSINELRGLEQSLDETLMNVRQRKYHVITTQTETYKKKFKNTLEAHRNLLRELEMKDDHQEYGFVTEDAAAIANESAHHMFAFRVQPSQPNLHGLGFGSYDRSLA